MRLSVANESAPKPQTPASPWVPKLKNLLTLLTSQVFTWFMAALVALLILIGGIKLFPPLEPLIFSVSKDVGELRFTTTVLENNLQKLSADVSQLKTLEQELANLKSSLNNLDSKLESLKAQHEDTARKVGQIRLADGSQATESMRRLWGQVMDNYAEGRAFKHHLLGMIPHLASFKEAIDAIHALSPFAEEDTQTTGMLMAALRDIESNLSHGTSGGGSWFKRLWYKMRGLIKVKPENQPAPTTPKPEQQSETLAAIHQTLALMDEGKLKQGVEFLHGVPNVDKALFEQWFIHAQKRVNLDQAFTKLKGLVQAFLK